MFGVGLVVLGSAGEGTRKCREAARKLCQYFQKLVVNEILKLCFQKNGELRKVMKCGKMG